MNDPAEFDAADVRWEPAQLGQVHGIVVEAPDEQPAPTPAPPDEMHPR